MKLSTAAAISCAVAVFATATADVWAGGRGGSGGRGASGGGRGGSHSSGAHHHHSHTRVFVGSSFFYGPAYYPPYYAPYYAPVPVYVEPEAPAVYIEQGQDPDLQVWYYCQSAGAYYPYATECPEG